MNTHEESKQDNRSHGVTIKVYVTPDTDVDATVQCIRGVIEQVVAVQRIRGVIEQVVAANTDHIAVTGNVEIGNADQVEPDYELAPEPEPPNTEYKFPPFGE